MSPSSPPRPPGHRPRLSSLGDLTMLELDLPHTKQQQAEINEIEINVDGKTAIPKSSLVIVAEKTELLAEPSGDGKPDEAVAAETSFVANISEYDFAYSKIKVTNWTQDKFYSDYIHDGLEYIKTNKPIMEGKKADDKPQKVVMLFESPSSSSENATFHNREKFKFHDWPPPKSTRGKEVLGPCKYSLMNGTTYDVFLRGGIPPVGLKEHWSRTLHNQVPMPNFVDIIHTDDLVYAYLPVEQIKYHVNDPTLHYHLAGKDSIVLMTQKTTRLLPDTRTVRPCVVKTTHSMGSKGIFIIRNDDDEKEFEDFLKESGEPTFVVTDFVDINRNVACHFFMHPNGKNVTWFGSNENKRLPNGQFSSDSYLEMSDQEQLKQMQLPFVEEVVQYCHNLGFWGFCGIDVLFDSKGRGYLCDINPRVTGSCPALMTLQLMQKKYGFQYGFFRRSGDINYYGTPEQLFQQVHEYNDENDGKSLIVIHSYYEMKPGRCRLNIGVYGNDMENNKKVLNEFAQPVKTSTTTPGADEEDEN